MMGFVEHVILEKGNILKALIFNRNTFIMKNEFKIANLSAIVEESKVKQSRESIRKCLEFVRDRYGDDVAAI